MSRAPFASFALVMLGSCGLGTEICTTSVEPGVVITVTDSVSGAPRATGATGLVREGSFSDDLEPYGSNGQGELLSLAGAYERPGRYTVEITRAGYQPWSRSGILVTRGSCHVRTAEIRARLVPQP